MTVRRLVYVAFVVLVSAVLLAAIVVLTFGIDWPDTFEVRFRYPFASKPAYIPAPMVLLAPPILVAFLLAFLGVVVPVPLGDLRRAGAGATVLSGLVVFALALGPVWCTDTIPPVGYGHGFAVDPVRGVVRSGGHHAGRYACRVDVSSGQLAAAYGLVTAGLAVRIRPSVLDGFRAAVRRHVA